MFFGLSRTGERSLVPVTAGPGSAGLFPISECTETPRVNGRARLLRDALYFDAIEVRGRRPVTALEAALEEVYLHCAKAFLRSGLWRLRDWPDGAGPSSRQIATTFVGSDENAQELIERYAPLADPLLSIAECVTSRPGCGESFLRDFWWMSSHFRGLK